VLCVESGTAHQLAVSHRPYCEFCPSYTFRYHTIQEFNKGVYDYIIATDETGGKNEEQDSDGENDVDITGSDSGMKENRKSS
jgi:hypothetical protein